MLFALWWRDVIAVVLAGFVVANTLHAINHALDRDRGRPSDWWQLGMLSLFSVVGIAVRLRQIRAKHAETPTQTRKAVPR